jgi:hypothetical protein
MPMLSRLGSARQMAWEVRQHSIRVTVMLQLQLQVQVQACMSMTMTMTTEY